TPVSELSLENRSDIDLETLGLEAQTLFDQSLSDELDGSTQQVLATLVAVGSSGGARPKAQIYMPAGDTTQCRTYAQPGDEAWLVKFTSKN
ncbi:type II toxin-antitoxin system HipA family toxin, partial [Vibrio sp. F13]